MENVAHVRRFAPGARAGHTAVRAGNSVLIWGGYDEPVGNMRLLLMVDIMFKVVDRTREPVRVSLPERARGV